MIWKIAQHLVPNPLTGLLMLAVPVYAFVVTGTYFAP